MEFIGLLYYLLKAIPILDSWFKKCMIFYAEKEVEWFNEALLKNIEKATNGDTSDLERQVGSPRAGKPSGYKDSKIVDSVDV